MNHLQENLCKWYINFFSTFDTFINENKLAQSYHWSN